jgi:hypothetical protein
MDLPVGSSILKMSLRLCNDTYDFTRIESMVNSYAIEAIFSKFESNQATRQSSLFFGLLKLTCDASNFSDFYYDLIDFLKTENISQIL